MINNKGFTLIELILVVVLMSIITAMSATFYTRFINQNAVLNTVDQLVGEMHKAQIYAMSGKQNSSWGVNYGAQTITLYSGNSYGARNSAFDETFSVNATVSVSGMTDLNFARATGLPSVSPTATISGANNTKTITINSQGGINR
jgi:prepilin-type N-terminal cleavage/methylation domain-containing protein